MKKADEILGEIKEILATKWQTRDGIKVPEPEHVRLGNDAVKLNGTVLYADLEDSTGLVKGYKDWFAAEVYKSYLVAACRIIRNNDGVITAFDGDRVMAVYVGDSKNTNAAKTALQINWVVGQINELIKKEYSTTSFVLKHTVGIDTSDLFVARTGIRNSNDLVWVGRAANYAAKLAAIDDGGYSLFISEQVFNTLSDPTKNGGTPKRCMWQKSYWSDVGITIYKSNWIWKVP
ncbi:MAG: adenylate/guanylate cyclase domain-containing protein [Verrucomicrobia bacterium]|jgi:class 3 adenylate cyclase|nr:MAG: adenylate/guanylate cyclase domain-containing protein [Verrucomicrobiota bacterium]